MAISSRRSLLPRPKEKEVSLWVILPICGVIIIAWAFPIILGHPLSLDAFLFAGVLIFVGVFALIQSVFDRMRLRQMVEERKNDSICTFACSFDYRHIDTRIIRAVYEETQHSLIFPVRASDDFQKDLNIDPEDLEDMAQIIAYRTRRSLNNFQKNPFYGQVNTVAGLVLFFSRQPLLA